MPTIRIDQHVYEALKQYAREHNMTFTHPNDVIRAVLGLNPKHIDRGSVKPHGMEESDITIFNIIRKRALFLNRAHYIRKKSDAPELLNIATEYEVIGDKLLDIVKKLQQKYYDNKDAELENELSIISRQAKDVIERHKCYGGC